MTIALLFSLLVGLFSDTTTVDAQAEVTTNGAKKIVRPIITDDTGG